MKIINTCALLAIAAAGMLASQAYAVTYTPAMPMMATTTAAKSVTPPTMPATPNIPSCPSGQTFDPVHYTCITTTASFDCNKMPDAGDPSYMGWMNYCAGQQQAKCGQGDFAGFSQENGVPTMPGLVCTSKTVDGKTCYNCAPCGANPNIYGGMGTGLKTGSPLVGMPGGTICKVVVCKFTVQTSTDPQKGTAHKCEIGGSDKGSGYCKGRKAEERQKCIDAKRDDCKAACKDAGGDGVLRDY